MDNIFQLDFYYYLSLKDFLNLLSINKEYKIYNKDYVYKYYLEEKISTKFTESLKRESNTHKYLNSLKKFVIFENRLKKNGYHICQDKEYYHYSNTNKY